MAAIGTKPSSHAVTTTMGTVSPTKTTISPTPPWDVPTSASIASTSQGSRADTRSIYVMSRRRTLQFHPNQAHSQKTKNGGAEASITPLLQPPDNHKTQPAKNPLIKSATPLTKKVNPPDTTRTPGLDTVSHQSHADNNKPAGTSRPTDIQTPRTNGTAVTRATVAPCSIHRVWRRTVEPSGSG